MSNVYSVDGRYIVASISPLDASAFVSELKSLTTEMFSDEGAQNKLSELFSSWVPALQAEENSTPVRAQRRGRRDTPSTSETPEKLIALQSVFEQWPLEDRFIFLQWLKDVVDCYAERFMANAGGKVTRGDEFERSSSDNCTPLCQPNVLSMLAAWVFDCVELILHVGADYAKIGMSPMGPPNVLEKRVSELISTFVQIRLHPKDCSDDS